jgi:hypothetical protein
VLSIIDDLFIPPTISAGSATQSRLLATTVELCAAASPRQNVQRVLDPAADRAPPRSLLAKRAGLGGRR